MGVLGIKSTGRCSFSTESPFAFFGKGFLVDDAFNLRFCTNNFTAFGVCSEWPFSLLETSFGAFVALFQMSIYLLVVLMTFEDIDNDNEDDNVDDDNVLTSFSACSIL